MFLPAFHPLAAFVVLSLSNCIPETPFPSHVNKFPEEERFQDKSDTHWAKQIKDLFTVEFVYCESLKWGL